MAIDEVDGRSANPFIYGRPLAPTEFSGRRAELEALIADLAEGISVAICGGVATGKTTLLKCIQDKAILERMGGPRMASSALGFLDGHIVSSTLTLPMFWARVLRPMAEQPGLKQDVAEAVRRLPDTGGRSLDDILLTSFDALSAVAAPRLILVLDEFGGFLDHPFLHCREFYGGLRTIANNYKDSFAVVLASDLSVAALHERTLDVWAGSPFFNHLHDIELTVLNKDEWYEVVGRAGARFGTLEKKFVSEVSGRHPYLTQAAAGILWNVCAEGHVGRDRFRKAADRVIQLTKRHFDAAWQRWQARKRIAATVLFLRSIAPLQEGGVLAEGRVDFGRLGALGQFESELGLLKKDGVAGRDGDGEWAITQQAFGWWFAERIRPRTSDPRSFGDWLREEGMDAIGTPREVESAWSGVWKQGQAGARKLVEVVIEAMVRGSIFGA